MATSGSGVEAAAGGADVGETVSAKAAPSVALASVFGTTGALQHPFGVPAWAPDIAAQQPLGATGATGALQHAGRPAARTGAKTSDAKRIAANLLGFIMTIRPKKIPAEACGGNPAENRGLPRPMPQSRHAGCVGVDASLFPDLCLPLRGGGFSCRVEDRPPRRAPH